MPAEVDALLERLVAQFESPYDFVRELVQNAMDAGSDRVEVMLETHPASEEDADAVVFELSVLDTGAGMDEAIIDQELTRLFSSGKSGDRTMAGGFGIGFVSVFAWEPDAVLVHTGRGGECWELVFHGDRSFEKVAVEGPIEGTTISMFRRGRASERVAIAEAIRDSLWRWCRYCPLELSFEDLDGDDAPELIQDSPEPAQFGRGRSLSETEVRGESTLRVSFAVPPNAVFLRRGLILAEGSPRALLGALGAELGSSAEHLQIWADSPLLRTSMARDKVLDDSGRAAVDKRLFALLGSLREQLLTRIETEARVGEGAAIEDEPAVDPHWTRERHELFTALHAHLELELDSVGRAYTTRALFRDLVHAKAVSLEGARARMKSRPLLISTPPALLRAADPRADSGMGDRIVDGIEALLAALRPTRLVVLAAAETDDQSWLRALEARAPAGVCPIERALARVEPRQEQGRGLCGLIEAALRGLGFEQVELVLADFVDVRGRSWSSPLAGPEVPGASEPLAFHGGGPIRAASLERRKLWLNAHNPLVEAGVRSFASEPLLSGLSLSAAILALLDEAPEHKELAKLGERMWDAQEGQG